MLTGGNDEDDYVRHDGKAQVGNKQLGLFETPSATHGRVPERGYRYADAHLGDLDRKIYEKIPSQFFLCWLASLA